MKFQSYHNFRQRIHRAAKRNGFPLRAMFELTYRCNFHCKHCYVPRSYRKNRELKTKEVFSVLDQLKDMGCFYLGFTGGEPFIRKDIMKILRYAKGCGFELIIYTNGSLINGKIAGQLARLRPNKIDITIPAMSKDAFEHISGAAGSRDRVFRTIDLLNKKGVNLGFKSCVLKENEKEIEEIQAFAASLNAPHRLDDMLSPRLDGSKEPYRYRGERTAAVVPHAGLWRAKEDSLPCVALAKQGGQKSEIRREREFADCDLEDSRKTPAPERLFKCGAGVSQAAITPSGKLKMCVMIDYPKYDVLKSSLKDAWQKLRTRVKRIKPDKNYRCNKCELEPYCKWCPARGWLEDRKFTSCDLESRRWVKTRIQRLKNNEK